MENIKCILCPKIPTRYTIALMSLCITALTYGIRGNLSITMLVMVQPKDQLQNETDVSLGQQYPWTPYEQSLMLGGFFYGHSIGLVPLGLLLDRYQHVRLWTFNLMLLATIMEFISPLVFDWSWTASFILRVLIGITQSGVFPSIHKLFARWAPPNELGKFTSSTLGSGIGTSVGWALTGFMVETYGWPSSFYVMGAIMVLFLIAWWFAVYDSPADHPRISPEERKYIEDSLVHCSGKRAWPPVWKIIKSLPVWTLFFLQYSSLWGLFFNITAAPMFMHAVLGFKLSSTGLLVGFPHIVRWICSVFFAFATDYFRAKNLCSLLNLRRIMAVFSHMIPGLMFIALPYVSYDPYLCVTFITISMAFCGAVAQSTLSNFHDISPTFAPSLFTLINGAGISSGFLSPLLVTYFTSEKNTIAEWQYIFLVGAVFYIFAACFFILFGSTDVQDWDGGIVVKLDKKITRSNSCANSETKIVLNSIDNENVRA